MHFLYQYSMFLLQCMTLVVAFLLLLAGLFAISKKNKNRLTLRHVNQEYQDTQQLLTKKIKGKKQKKAASIKNEVKKNSLFVMDFQGDIKASAVEQLREAITAILSVAEEKDEVLVRIESPGGMVSGYGLAASQLQRIRDKKLHLTVAIDKIAASGGYLMACIAHQILAAPFATVGSIGVVCQMPNMHRWLKKHDIDIELLTAGEYKRTLTVLGENTEKGRQKFQEDLEKIHKAFRTFVFQNRPRVQIEEVATGEHWLAQDAFDLGLVDILKTSDAYLIEKMDTHQVYHIEIRHKPSLMQKILRPAAALFFARGYT